MQEQNNMINEFQLNELEERLEMAALGESHYCCECVGNPFCEPL